MYKQKNYQISICRYYLMGACKFGTNCRFLHPETNIQCLLIRHAESEFNFVLNNSKYHFHSEQAKQEYQINTDYIDCKVTKKGIMQIRNMQIPESVKENEHIIVDAIFVSPLKRALYTARQMLRFHRIKYLQVIVIPSLTEVLSKICDLSGCMEEKIEKFSKFNFAQFQKWKGKKDIKTWQDQLVDPHLVGMIDSSQQNGTRYLKILETVFPEPLQSRNRCFNRAVRTLGQIKKICIEKGFKKIIIVSHNRILKYMEGKQSNGKGESFDNCQVRKIFI